VSHSAKNVRAESSVSPTRHCRLCFSSTFAFVPTSFTRLVSKLSGIILRVWGDHVLETQFTTHNQGYACCSFGPSVKVCIRCMLTHIEDNKTTLPLCPLSICSHYSWRLVNISISRHCGLEFEFRDLSHLDLRNSLPPFRPLPMQML